MGFLPFQTIYIDINFKYSNNDAIFHFHYNSYIIIKLCLLLHYGSSPKQKNNKRTYIQVFFYAWKASMSGANNIFTAIILLDRNNGQKILFCLHQPP